MVSALFNSPTLQNQSGDRLVSKVAGAAIAALFKRSEQIEANVRAEPVTKLLQGSLDGFDFIGKGMLMYNGLRIEALELYLQAVAIDFSAIFTGQVKLRQPTQARMRAVLTEADLTASFNTQFVVEKLQRLQYQGQSLQFRKTEVRLTGDQTLEIESQIQIGSETSPLTVQISAEVEVEDRRRIQFVKVEYQGNPQAIELGKALIDHVNHLLDLDKFALEQTQLRIDRLRVQNRQIVCYGIAQINQFPRGKRSA